MERCPSEEADLSRWGFGTMSRIPLEVLNPLSFGIPSALIWYPFLFPSQVPMDRAAAFKSFKQRSGNVMNSVIFDLLT